MLQFTVEESRCTRCRQCVDDCPSRIIAQQGDAVPFIAPEGEAACIHCQHCLAVCPTGAVSIFGRDPDDSLPLTANSFPTFEQMTLLLRGRRSVRQYKDENVDPTLIRQLLTTLANAPTGVNRQELTFMVIDDKAVMARWQGQVMSALKSALADGRIPPRYAYLQAILSWKEDYAAKFFFRTAPHALLISAPPDAPCPDQDIALALAYFELLAQSAGLGAVWWGMLHMAMDLIPELKSFWGLPDNHRYYAMLFGLPAVRYARTVQRDDGAIIKTVTG
ncbi:MAG TPA: nitroreductase family protein [Armatimonadota bacterium]|jgi:ferredoxin